MKTTQIASLAAVLLVAASTLPTLAQTATPRERYEGATVGTSQRATEGVGTVVYDPGAPADTIVALPGGLNLHGNLFDTQNGTPLSSGAITGVSWYAPANGTFAIWAADPSGSATILTIVYAGIGGTFNSVGVAYSASGPLFVGIDAGYSGSFGSVGLRSATVNGQGFHGQRRSAAPPSSSLAGQNVMLRVSGSIVVPVELQEFDVE